VFSQKKLLSSPSALPIFGSHAHQMIKKHKNAQKEIEHLKTANEQLAQEIAALKNV